MIVVNKAVVKPKLLAGNTIDYETKNKILTELYENQEVFTYQTVEQLEFDIALRYHLIIGSQKLFYSGFQFRDFYSSYCNQNYWIRTPVGGFKLQPNQRASTALLDIFSNGQLYGTECATAIMIIIYYALLNVMREEDFDRVFQNLLLYTWNYENSLKLKTIYQNHFVSGDIVYFKNPQVHPLTPQWQGENTVFLGNDYFYGHGAGINTAEHIIMKLNNNRIPGAYKSAYITDHVTRIDSNQMSRFGYVPKIATDITLETLHQRDFTLLEVGNFSEVYF